MENPIIIFGAKSLGITALEIFQQNQALVYCFLDDDAALHGEVIGNISVYGATDNEGFTKLIGKKCDAFVALDNLKLKQNIISFLLETRNVMPVNAIHPKSYVSENASLGHGNLICAGATLSAISQLGSHCIMGVNSVIDSNSVIGDFVQIGSNSVISSDVAIADGAFIGAGVTIISGIKIGKNARIGAGSVVMADVKASQTVFGVPAVEIKK